jgi:hypothetical protein
LLTLSIEVNGNAIYGKGSVGANCSNGTPEWTLLYFSGTIASDGSFKLTNSTDPLGIFQVTIAGNVPANGTTAWSGNYTMTNLPTQASCNFNTTSSFTAAAYSPMNGTYAGTITHEMPDPVGFSTQISQGTSTESASGATNYYIPLSATATVSGNPCFTTGTTAANMMSSVSGNSFTLTYTMDDGSTLYVSGVFSDADETALQILGANVVGGNCSGEYVMGTLTGQTALPS